MFFDLDTGYWFTGFFFDEMLLLLVLFFDVVPAAVGSVVFWAADHAVCTQEISIKKSF